MVVDVAVFSDIIKEENMWCFMWWKRAKMKIAQHHFYRDNCSYFKEKDG